MGFLFSLTDSSLKMNLKYREDLLADYNLYLSIDRYRALAEQDAIMNEVFKS